MSERNAARAQTLGTLIKNAREHAQRSAAECAQVLNLTAEVTRLEGQLRGLDSSITDEEVKRARQQAKVNRFPGVDRSVRIRAEVSRMCSDGFAQAIERFREKARNKVSKEADVIFLSMFSHTNALFP